MKKLDHLSISSLKLHQYSPAKWALAYLEGLKEPPTHHLEFGKKIHSEIEDIYEKQEADFQVIPEHRLDFWKQWYENNKDWFGKSNWNIESSFRIYLSPELPPFEGRIDMWRCSDDGIVEIVDHKTCTKGYELSETDLFNDWQLALYAYVLNPTYSSHVAHNQLFKNKNMELIGYRYVGTFIGWEQQMKLIEEIKKESKKVLHTIDQYGKLGLQAIERGAANAKHYGRADYHWPLINGDITLEEFKNV